MTGQEAKELAEKLAYVWAPCNVDEGLNSGAGWCDFTYRAQVAPGVQMDIVLGHVWGASDDASYQLISDEVRLLWDEKSNECRSWTDPEHRTCGWEEREQTFVARWMPSLRRGCYLSGCGIECTEHEKLEWTLWLEERLSQMKAIEQEAHRVAAAFGVKEWEANEFDQGWQMQGEGCRRAWVTWLIHSSSYEWFAVQIGDRVENCTVYERDSSPVTWECEPYYLFNDVMARGLYCLGFEDEGVLAQLGSPLNAHEKLELRLAMPRNFWPKTWLDEVAATL